MKDAVEQRVNMMLTLPMTRPFLVAIINFRFQLNVQYFISITMLLYMFRATLRPSSGGPLYIYNIWFYVSLKLIYKI